MIITLTEAASRLNITRARLYALIREDRVQGAHKSGGTWLMPWPAIIKPSDYPNRPQGVADKQGE